ncbi:ANTAR domain-containing protein [Streptomyces syringium]|uniref:ANTAR domain-containing protein n=1 Tax=Streptomyces syringium TaxID=76729 RepID=UPI003D8D5605
MKTMAREDRVLEVVVGAVDTLVEDFDLIDFLHMLCDRCVELLDVQAVGVMLADPGGNLEVIAASDEHTRLLELFALQHDQGPCVECHRTGTARLDIDLTSPETVAAFPEFAARARRTGFTFTHALPMRLRDDVVGAMNLFQHSRRPLTTADVRLAQTLADVATIAILQQRTIEHASVERSQLEAALHSRILIEQAKGILAERRQTSVDEAFEILRGYARPRRLRLVELCRQVVNGELDIAIAFP